MPFNIQIPISYVRSTNEKPSLVERRRRPDFLLSLNVDTLSPNCAAHSLSTTPELSPSFSPWIITTSGTPFSGPNTPVDEFKPHWTRQTTTKAPIEPARLDFHLDTTPTVLESPTFNHVAWSSMDVDTSPQTPIISVAELQNSNTNPVHFDPLIQRCHSPLPNPAAPSPTPDPANAEPESRSPPMQRVLRRRSGRSHNRDLVISNPLATRRDKSLLTNYRQLAEKECKALKLDIYRRHYKCLMDGCERVFGRKSNVENHIRTHLDDKPFVCSLDTCQAAFVRKGDLQRHEQIHQPSRSHMCSCGQTFSRNDALTKHIRKGICGPSGSSVFA